MNVKKVMDGYVYSFKFIVRKQYGDTFFVNIGVRDKYRYGKRDTTCS